VGAAGPVGLAPAAVAQSGALRPAARPDALRPGLAEVSAARWVRPGALRAAGVSRWERRHLPAEGLPVVYSPGWTSGAAAEERPPRWEPRSPEPPARLQRPA